MGRHADPDPRHFWRSFGVAFLRATLALALVVGLFAALSTVGGGNPPGDGPVMLGEPDEPGDERPETSTAETAEPDPPPDVAADPDADADEAPPDADDEAPPDAGVDPPEDAANAEGGLDATDPDAALLAAAPPPAETTVQVLDGVGASPLLDVLAAALEEMGYEVVALNPASTDYAVTTVLYSEGREAAAEALQARDPRITERRPNPGLSEDVDLHVVLGADWRP